jgi:NADH-quinone oxidoreductase subunit I
MAKPQVPGLLKGLGVTLATMMQTIKPKRLGGGAATVQYPHEKETPTTRARGVIALREDNCTSCMLCVRSCPDWCIYIEGHKELRPPRRERLRVRRHGAGSAQQRKPVE